MTDEEDKYLRQSFKPSLETVVQTVKDWVFDAEFPIIVAINGGWGEGKTYTWKRIILPEYPSVRTGYVSVFGATTLLDIRQRILAEATTQLAEETSSRLNDIEKWIYKAKYGDKFVSASNYIVEIYKKYSHHLTRKLSSKLGIPDELTVKILEDSVLKDNWILCVDDVERLSKDIDIGAFMGILNEYKIEYGLKIVLIYSHDKLEKNKEAFTRYQEKVIDHTARFVQDTEFVIRNVFKTYPEVMGDDIVQSFVKIADVLDHRNIRLYEKTRRDLDEVIKRFESRPTKEFIIECLAALLLANWIKYFKAGNDLLNIEYLYKYYSYMGLPDESEEDDGERKKANSLLKNYGWLYTSELDKILIRYVDTDVLDKVLLLKEHENYANDKSAGQADSELRELWDSYFHSSMRADGDEFCDKIIETTEKNMVQYNVPSVDNVLSILYDLGRKKDAKNLLKEFVNKRRGIFASYEPFPGHPLRYKPLQEKVDLEKKATDVDKRDIREVIDSIMDEKFMQKNDRVRMSEFSDKEYIEYFSKSNHKRLLQEIDFLAKADKHHTKPGKYESVIVVKMSKVIGKLSHKNRFNKIKFKRMGIIS